MAVADVKFDLDLMDLAVEAGDVVLLTGNAACRQRLVMACHVHKGNWAWNLNLGVPWASWFRRKPAPLGRAVQFLRNYLRDELGVADIPEMTIEVDADRRAAIRYTFTLADGEGGVDSTLLGV